ncbi:hypothetical protein B0H13DRAFT_1932386 [Mycena leptocephala]|nr:hypothetical protein B0H13DRAFT_1932386 [Mycena leptocephala]
MLWKEISRARHFPPDAAIAQPPPRQCRMDKGSVQVVPVWAPSRAATIPARAITTRALDKRWSGAKQVNTMSQNHRRMWCPIHFESIPSVVRDARELGFTCRVGVIKCDSRMGGTIKQKLGAMCCRVWLACATGPKREGDERVESHFHTGNAVPVVVFNLQLQAWIIVCGQPPEATRWLIRHACSCLRNQRNILLFEWGARQKNQIQLWWAWGNKEKQ